MAELNRRIHIGLPDHGLHCHCAGAPLASIMAMMPMFTCAVSRWQAPAKIKIIKEKKPVAERPRIQFCVNSFTAVH